MCALFTSPIAWGFFLCDDVNHGVRLLLLFGRSPSVGRLPDTEHETLEPPGSGVFCFFVRPQFTARFLHVKGATVTDSTLAAIP